jgi:Tripartite tricarboxylate transporter family receptor
LTNQETCRCRQRVAPDGYTLLRLDGDQLAAVPTCTSSAAVPTDSKFKSLGDIVAAAKASPGKVTYGSWGSAARGISAARCSSGRPAPRCSTSVQGSQPALHLGRRRRHALEPGHADGDICCCGVRNAATQAASMVARAQSEGASRFHRPFRE